MPVPTPPARLDHRSLRRWRAAMVWLALGSLTTLGVIAPISGQEGGGPAPTAQPAPAQNRPIVQGPPDGLIPPPQVQPARPALPVLNPQPVPVQSAPAPIRTPTPTRTAPANPAPPRESDAPARPAPQVRSTPAPAPVPTVSPAASGDQPIAPLPDAPAAPIAAEEAPAPTPAAPQPALAPATTWPEWVPLVAMLGLLALIGGAAALLNRRRKHRAAAENHPFDEAPAALPDAVALPPVAAPAIPASSPPAPQPAPAMARAITGRAELSISLEPLSATSTLLNFRLRYALTLSNHGAVDAADIQLRMAVFAGSTANPYSINQWFLELPDANDSRITTIVAGADQRIEGELAVPMEALAPITVEGRTIAIPLIAIDARYRHPAGESPLEAQSAQAFIVGRDAGGAAERLAPFRFDQGPGEFTGIAARDAGLSQRS